MDFSFSTLRHTLPAVLENVPSALAIILGGLVLLVMVDRSIRLIARKTSLPMTEVAPLGKIAKWIIGIVTAILVLGAFGLNLGGLWTVFSTLFAMVAIGFVAVWSVLSNALCTLMILIFRPFAVGDEVEFAGEPVRGRVIDINFIYTTLRAEDGSSMQIPNNLFFQKVLKRRAGRGSVSLADQLNRREPAEV